MTDRTITDRPIRWGIASTGSIAASMTQALQTLDEGPNVAAVRPWAHGPRTRPMSSRSASRFPRAHGTYEDLFADPDVDIVYIASPHSSHCEMTVAALRAGKHVLVREAVRRQRRRGAHDGRHRPSERTLPDGGDVDVVHPRGRRRQAPHRRR